MGENDHNPEKISQYSGQMKKRFEVKGMRYKGRQGKKSSVKRINPNRFRLLTVILTLFIVSGCGYGFRGTVNNLPPDIKSIAIPVFINESIEPGVEVVFANSLIYEFSRSHVLQVVSESQAQAQINGKIKAIAIDPVIYANLTQALERKVTVILEITCRRSDDQKILWQNQGLSRYENFRVSTDQNQTQRNKEEAIKKIAQDLSERIHNSILENF
jgi:outer membrane lipopolysaccharide assembly protein LptE/RlpB